MKTAPSLQKKISQLAALAMAITTISVTSHADAAPVIVQDSDITGGTAYNFQILSGDGTTGTNYYGQYGPGGTGPGYVSSSNFEYLLADGGTLSYQRLTTNTSAGEFILGWDFSATSFKPTQLSLKTLIVDFTVGPKATWTYSYSTDNFDYTPFFTFNDFADDATKVINIAGAPDAFYIKFAVTSPAPIGFAQVQLGRANVNTPSITANFTVVPEPSTIMLAGLGVALVIFRLTRRSTSSVA